jgi:mRNA-degrading endonuclease RelE of RelBE toxin-antitoxin system
MEFIEATAFTRQLRNYLSEDEYRGLQDALAENPAAGDVMPGTGGFRKMRWADERRGKGKRGGLRVIYFHFEEDDQIWLLTLYGKDEAADLSNPQKKALQAAIMSEKAARRARRSGRR